MSLWADYIKERLGEEAIEYDWGFLTYHVEPPDICVLDDLYVQPGERRRKRAKSLVEGLEVAMAARGCNTLIAYVWPAAGGSTESLHAALRYGFRLNGVDGARIILRKEIKGE